MSLLLSSVSASAIIAGGGGYPSSPSLTLVHTETDTANTTNNFTFSYNFTETGDYLMAIYGGQGGAGTADSRLEKDVTIDGGASILSLGFEENADYEVISFYHIRIQTEGVHEIDYDQSGTRYRIEAKIYKTTACDFSGQTNVITTQTGSSATATISAAANNAYLGVFQGRGSPTYNYAGTSGGAIPVLEDDFKATTVTGVFSSTQSEDFEVLSSTNNRQQVGVIMIPYLSEEKSISLLIDNATTYVVTGSGKLSIRNAPVYIVANSAPKDKLSVLNSAIYLVATGY
ncbi:thioredoxin [Sulfitobacter phage vB_SupP_AX]|nr:thioredoxin [Sulfitobacter phage vB_SupP_AX]